MTKVGNEALVKIFEHACEILEEHGYEANCRPSYSGRAMYGDTIPGIVTDASGTFVGAAIIEAYYAQYSDVEDEFMPTEILGDVKSLLPKRTDSMGFQTIYY